MSPARHIRVSKCFLQVGNEYCSLIGQHMAAEMEESFVRACLAVGSSERSHNYKPERFDSYKSQSVIIATIMTCNNNGGGLYLGSILIAFVRSVLRMRV